MPDLKDKYSDTELDPSNAASDEIFNRPDMQALNDQGDATARELENAEKSPSSPDNSSEGDGKDAARREEAADWNNPENRFYQPTEKTQLRINKWSNRRKLAVFGGGGGAVSAVVIAFFTLLPMKVPGIMQLVMDTTGQRVEQITEKRAKLILGRAILTKFGTHTGVVITGEGAFKTLVASMRTSGFEKRLAAKGLTITPTPDGVKLTYKGKPLGNGTTFKNESAIINALENDRNIDNKLLKTIIKEDIPSWRWMKRAKFAKWLRIKYGIPRYGLTNSQKSDPEEKKKDMDADRVKAANERTMLNFREMLGCLMGGSCSKVDGSESPSKKAKESTSTADDIAKAGDSFAADVADNGLKATTETSTKLLLKTFGSKAIPIIGWIDIIATLDHFANETIGDNDYFGKIAAYYKGAAYAAVFADWSGYGSQIQEGGMDPEYVGVLADSLDGAEKAQAFQAIQGNASAGVPVSLKVDSDKPSSVKQLFDNIKNSPIGFGNKYVGHPVLNAYYETIGGGGFLNWLAGWVGGLVSSIINILGSVYEGLFGDALQRKIEELALETVSQIGPYVLKTFGFTLDAFDRGASLMNNIFGGGVVSTNDYCKEIGCRKLSTEQTSIQNASIAVERADYRRQMGLAYALFSPEESTSLTSQITTTMPTSATSGLSALGAAITSIPSKLASIISPRTAAANTTFENLYGVAPYGATTADLNRPLSAAFLNGGNDGEGCPEVTEGDFNDCTVDTEVAKAMQCEYDSNSVDCSDTDPSTAAQTEDASSFTVASYNILHSTSHTPQSISVGGCKKDPVPNDPTCGKTRAARQAQIITGQAGTNPVFDLVATQETSPEQYDALKGLLPGYGVFPDNTSRLNNAQDGAVAVFWNKAKFSRFDAGKTPGKSNTSIYVTNPWVGLKTSSGQKVYFISIHYAIAALGGTPDSIRESSELTMDWVRSKATGDNIVIVGGDFNDALGEKLSYCVYTRNGLMQHAVDMAADANPSAGCSALRFRGIDHIYATPTAGLTAKQWTQAPETGIYRISSDHTPVYVTYSLPSDTSAGGGVGGWSWPVDKKWWNSDRADFLDAHTMKSDTFTSPSVAGIASDISNPPDGTTVYAMQAGKVVREDSCAIIVRSTVAGGTLDIAYGHSVNHKVSLNAQVTSGQALGGIGANCNATGGHLHVDMSYGGKHICPQDVFLAMGTGKEPDLAKLTSEGIAPCGR